MSARGPAGVTLDEARRWYLLAGAVVVGAIYARAAWPYLRGVPPRAVPRVALDAVRALWGMRREPWQLGYVAFTAVAAVVVLVPLVAFWPAVLWAGWRERWGRAE